MDFSVCDNYLKAFLWNFSYFFLVLSSNRIDFVNISQENNDQIEMHPTIKK